jgi:hypothetical protein
MKIAHQIGVCLITASCLLSSLAMARDDIATLRSKAEAGDVQAQLELGVNLQGRPNTGSGRTLTVPEPKTKDFMRLLVQLTKGTA